MRNFGQNFLQDSTQKINIAPKDEEYEVSVFGRGYGECIVICCGNNEYVIIDSFLNPETKNPIALDYLKCMNIDFDKIKKIVITHWHDDHIRGAFKIVKAVENDIKIVLNPIVMEEKFNQYISYGLHDSGDNGLSEMRYILNYIRNNKNSCDIALCNLRFYANEEKNNIELWTLSPQNIELVEYLNQLLFPEQNKQTSKSYISDNNLSLVILVKAGNSGALLGGDLENTSNNNVGWTAIVNNYQHKNTHPNIFKIPHHGSENGFYEGVWSNILDEEPVALITTFNKSTKLPKDSEIKKICKYSNIVYVIGGTEKDNTLERKVRKVSSGIKNLYTNIPIVGMVRYRMNMKTNIHYIEKYGKVTELLSVNDSQK